MCYLCKTMDVGLLSKMIGELLVDHDSVSLPGVGTFFATVVPSTFSDKGYTINPPYRKLSFIQGDNDDNLLVMMYAESNSLDEASARSVLVHFLKEMKEALKSQKSITLSGLGRLRATKDNNFFFVPNQDLDIFPDGFGLAAVSLKNNAVPEEEESNFSVDSIPSSAFVEGDPTSEKKDDAPSSDFKEVDKPADEKGNDAREVAPKRPGWWVWPVAVVGIAVAILAVFVVLSRVAPGITDPILYTPEELEIINH